MAAIVAILLIVVASPRQTGRWIYKVYAGFKAQRTKEENV